jgi:DUF1707 SHOCT-like domain
MNDVDGAASDSWRHRIGNAERDAATAALNAHREGGRLDAVEYEDRQVRVARARTWSDIKPLFDDLPQPHPVGMPKTPEVPSMPVPLGLGGQPAPPAPPVPGEGLLGGVVPPQYRSTVMALTPFAAMLLFFLTPGPGWIWFLGIPVMGILLYGAEGNAEAKRVQRRARDERRQLRRDRRDRR